MPTTQPAREADLADILFTFFRTHKAATVSRHLRQMMLQYIANHQQQPIAEPIHPGMLMMLYDLFEVLDIVGEELV